MEKFRTLFLHDIYAIWQFEMIITVIRKGLLRYPNY